MARWVLGEPAVDVALGAVGESGTVVAEPGDQSDRGSDLSSGVMGLPSGEVGASGALPQSPQLVPGGKETNHPLSIGVSHLAGGVPPGLPLSQWFLLVTAFGSLFMVAGKRYAEITLFEPTGARIRASLTKYSASYLRFVWATSAAIMITTYALWAFEIRQRIDHTSRLAGDLVRPFVIAVLRYAIDVGNAGEPEDIALRDRVV